MLLRTISALPYSSLNWFSQYTIFLITCLDTLFESAKPLIEYLDELGITLPNGYRTEINLDAIKWLEEISTHLKQGFILTIDYGYNSDELYCDHHHQGTLLCYNHHNINDDPYMAVGAQDITSHVNFTALQHWGFKNGIDCCGLTNQADFLLALGLIGHLRKIIEHEPDNYINYKKEAFLKR